MSDSAILTDPLFSSGRIGSMVVPNRFVRSATAERMADEDGIPAASLAEMYGRLAEGGVGLIVGGHAYVDRAGKCHPEMTAIDRDEMAVELRPFASAAHDGGARIALQINFGGGGCDPSVTPERLVPSIAPATDGDSCRALTEGEIVQLVDRFAAAAVRVREAGYDAVQIHGAHGYLVSQFLSPLRNLRADRWGGDIVGRSRFLKEIGLSVRAAVGPDFPLLVKLGIRDFENGGLTAEDGLWVVARLRDWGFDGVEISHGIGAPIRGTSGATPAEREAPLLGLARAANRATDLPVALVFGLRSVAAMREVIESGAADFVSMSRPLIVEPDIPRRFRSGESTIATCTSCGLCWPKEQGEGVRCRNAALTRAAR